MKHRQETARGQQAESSVEGHDETHAMLQRHSAIFEHLNDAIIVTDDAGLMVDVNPSCERMLGYPRDELLGRSVSMVHRPEDVDHIVRDALAGVAAHGEWRAELVFVRKDGKEGVALVVVKPLVDRQGNIIGTVGVNHEITERKRTENELHRLNKRLADNDRRKDEFLAMLAHELRNPLAPIRHAVEVLRLQPDKADAQEPLDAIERQLRQMTRLVDDLLDVARITRGKVALKLAPVALARIVDNAVESCLPAIDQAGHHLEVSLPPEALWVRADAVRLTQAVLNLLNNAITYTPAGGHIRVSVQEVDGQAMVSVRDNGVGIDEHHLKGIFGLFSQVAPTQDSQHGGLGIGLALVRGLVDLHGGRVEARSEGLGRGSEFLITLPLEATPRRAAAPPPAVAVCAPPLVSQGRPLRILVVDDNVDTANMLAMMLTLSGHETFTAHEGPGAIAATAEHRPDVVLLDIGLPGMSGYEAALQIRAHQDPTAPAPCLVALTGWSQESDKRRALEGGFDHHLTKPVDPSELAAVLSSAAARLLG